MMHSDAPEPAAAREWVFMRGQVNEVHAGKCGPRIGLDAWSEARGADASGDERA